jgi:hypothetical protein
MYQIAAQNQLDYFAKYQKSLQRIRRLKEDARLVEDIVLDLYDENKKLKEAMARALQVLLETEAK